jgi:arylsulfatase A-like enzyme
MKKRPNFLVILIDDLRYDEFGAGGHPYMKTPHIDRLAHEGALFERVSTPRRSARPNRASIMTGQYASRHGIIDNVARGAMSHRLPNYHLELQKLGYRDRAHRQVAHGQRRHAAPGLRLLGELRRPRPHRQSEASATTATTSSTRATSPTS